MKLDRKQARSIALGILGVLVVLVWARALIVQPIRRGGGSNGSALPQPSAARGDEPTEPAREAAAPDSGPRWSLPSSRTRGPATEGRDGQAPDPAGWRESPFLAERSQIHAPTPVGVSLEAPEGYVLNGILWDPEAPSAIVNNQVVVVGDRLGPWQVVEIQKEKVILSDGMTTQTLK